MLFFLFKYRCLC